MSDKTIKDTAQGRLTHHLADSRGLANHGWLISRHTFSFANYYNPERIHFGALRVLNDDIVKPGKGFGTHPHDNMEIVSIPLSGALEHKDSTGNIEVIETGEVQIMSAGSGLTHSEYNHSKTEDVNFLQIWVFPKEKNINPRYEQKKFDLKNNINSWTTVVAPDQNEALWINQNAWFTLGQFDGPTKTSYDLHTSGFGVYAFIIDGEARINGQLLQKRDGLGISDTNKLDIEILQPAKVLLVEIPMIFKA